jgi:uncharacterized membrane protein
MNNTSDVSPNPATDGSETEPVWTFRGYRLRSSEFTTAMVHFFRAEVHRANIWRQRLDTTTNWAVVTTGAIVTFAFSEPSGHHSVIILSTLLVTLFLFIEARRYRYYEIWSSRIRLMETDFFAGMLVPPFHPAPDWAESLAENLLQPHFPISIWEAIGRRLRRNYLWIYLILWAAWLAKTWLHPSPASTFAEMLDRAAIGQFPGWLVITLGLIFLSGLILVAFLTLGLHEASGEVFPRFYTVEAGAGELNKEKDTLSQLKAWFRPQSRRQQMMALIVTDQGHAVAERILKEMNRGVTGLLGKGMYTGSEHTVLLCALTVTEVGQLKHIVSQIDQRSFVIVTPAREVLGRGFSPLEEK